MKDEPQMISRTFTSRIVAAVNAGLLCLTFAVPTAFGKYPDRWYRMGDDPAQGTAAGPVENFGTGNTYDSAGSTSTQYQDLVPHNSPVYVDISGARPVSAATSDNWAIQFNGVDQYLNGKNLNIPSESVASTNGAENYAGISDRGYQVWVKPTALPAAGFFSRIIDDGEQHEFKIASTGFWAPETRNDSITSTAPVTLNAWAHIAQVRPNGVNGGSLAYVNGRAVVSQTGDYQSSTVDLIVGANAAGDGLGGTITPPETGSYFQGLIDDIDMYVLGGTYGVYSYTEDSGYFTDVFLPSKSATYSYVDSTGSRGVADGHNDKVWVPGDINFDGVRNQADVISFIAGWRSSNAATILGNGPKFGDYLTLGKGDLDLDGDTDIDDWVRLRTLFAGSGASLPSLSDLEVPEPGTAFLASLALVGVTLRARKIRLRLSK
jgi:concanavalin A-like lectin/glucanase superfamily protein/PEP-CTERM motif-containing protein